MSELRRAKRKNKARVQPKMYSDKEKNTATVEKSLVKSELTRDVQKAESQGDLKVQVMRALAKGIGLRDEKLAMCIIDQANRVQAPWSFGDAANGLEIALTVLLEMKPESAPEALLAVQMFGVHHAALSFLHRAAFQTKASEGSDPHLAHATSLMRLYIEQLEAMAKLKGKAGQQKVTVEHVHVHQGGQAIVGAVNAARSDPGEGGGSEQQTKTP